MKRFSFILISCLILAGCQGNPKVPAGGSDQESTSTTPPEPVEQEEPMTRPEVKAFMERWLKVYNTHTYDTYVSMYDPRLFVGVKRPHDRKKVHTTMLAGSISHLPSSERVNPKFL